MIELNAEQREAMARGEPVRLVEPETRDAYVLFRAVDYARLDGPLRLTRSSSERLSEGDGRATLALEPRSAQALGQRGHRIAAPHRSLEPLAKMPHRVQPAVGARAQPVQDRRKLGGYRPSNGRPDLPARPIQQRKIPFERDRQVAADIDRESSRCGAQSSCP
jgi:hypothetical protein